MAGFASVAATQAAASTTGGTSVATGFVLVQANVLAGTVVLIMTNTYKAAGSPPTNCDDIVIPVTVGGAPVKLAHYDDGFGRVEIWWARATSNATGNVQATVAFTATADFASGVTVRPFSGFPTEWEMRTSATYSRSTNATAHSCGSVSAVADEMLVTNSQLNGTRGTGTAASGFDGWAPSTQSWCQWMKTTGAVTTDAQWGSSNSRGVTSMQVVLAAPGGGGTPTMQPRVMFVL